MRLSSLLLETPQNSECERPRQRQGDEGRWHRLSEECYIDLFLTHVVIPYSGLYVFASLTRGSQLGATCPTPNTHRLLAGRAPNLLTARLTGRLWLTVILWVPVYIFFITPSRSGCDSLALHPHVNPRDLSSCLRSWNILSQKFMINGSFKGQHATPSPRLVALLKF